MLILIISIHQADWLYNCFTFAVMVRRTLQQILSQPKRPLNPYLKMRVEILKMLPIEYRKSSIINNEWRNIDPEMKAEMIRDYQIQKKQYNLKMKEWRRSGSELNQTIKSDSLLNSVREESQNSEQELSCIRGASKIQSFLRNFADDKEKAKSFTQIQATQNFYLEDSEDGAIENHLLEIKRLVKKKEKRWKKQRTSLLNIIRAERERAKNLQSEFSRVSATLRASIQSQSRRLQRF